MTFEPSTKPCLLIDYPVVELLIDDKEVLRTSIEREEVVISYTTGRYVISMYIAINGGSAVFS